MGYELEFDTGHSSGQFRNTTGPAIFVAEVPESQETHIQPVLGVRSPDEFRYTTLSAPSAPAENTPVRPAHHLIGFMTGQ